MFCVSTQVYGLRGTRLTKVMQVSTIKSTKAWKVKPLTLSPPLSLWGTAESNLGRTCGPTPFHEIHV